MTTAINRNTLQYYGGTPRSLPSGTWILNPDMSSVSGVALCYWKIIGDSVLEMDSGEKEVVDIQRLADARLSRFIEIDNRTEELIREGFVYQGKVFSLSENAQNYWLGMMLGKDLFPSGDFPLEINTKDDSGTYSVSAASEIPFMYGTAMGTVQARIASGTTLKKIVRSAASISGVQSVVDSR